MSVTNPSIYLDPASSSFASLTLFTITTLCLTIFARRVRKGYLAFLALGPGGTPSTPLGYLRICLLQVFILRNPLNPPAVPPHIHPQTGILKDLPKRTGSRPEVIGLAPQRQVTERGSQAMYAALTTAIKEFSVRHADSLFLATSCFEKHSTGLFSLPRCQSHLTCNGEVCHSHPSDGSMHLTLHPADVKTIIEKGWGERHPLARDSWWWKFRFVPPTFVLIYSPRNLEELRCITQIIYAASWWVSGIDLRKPVTARGESSSSTITASRQQAQRRVQSQAQGKISSQSNDDDDNDNDDSLKKNGQVRSSCSAELHTSSQSSSGSSPTCDMPGFPMGGA
ncbi:hypothetical protein FQN55_009421 [Onygenales sp. PD_40]|nr:hypothetical protein FQN55_009421 [Onygenales sp. PD_40]KAK2777056.1 hypothetical protein FQN52_003239 [Onygenales sp. PD_12]KAK2795572.1 hypothetical protein FQN51_000426 [Onygenales sp. PD_10]